MWSKVAMRAGVVAGMLAWGGCGESADVEAEKGAASAPTLGGKGDVASAVELRGALAFGAEGAVSSSFTRDLSFQGYTLSTRPGARVKLDITQRGSSRSLDTALYVYGPRAADGSWGDAAIAFDDDGGWGDLSRLSALTLERGGDYLVVVGTFNGRGRGAYRLEGTCLSGECAPLPPAPSGACHPDILASIEGCVAGWEQDPDHDPATTPKRALIEQCADIEPVAPARDALCAGASAPAEVCALSLEQLSSDYLPGCARELVGAALDETCVFGSRYGDVFAGSADALVVVSRRVLTSADQLDALTQAQIVAAVQRTAYDDVMTAAQAFAAVDGGEVNQTVLWDASARRAFAAYEVGAGDNSFGAYFVHGTTDVTAEIIDGDVLNCMATWGKERRECQDDAHCAAGARCIGRSEASPLGRCVDMSLDAARGALCDAQTACAVADGLVCGGSALGGEGRCEPAWQRGAFVSEPAAAIPDNRASGVEAQLLAYGLATVSTDVLIDLHIAHPRIADLRVSLINPASTEVPVFSGERDGAELYLRGVALRGFPGDESANGVWTLKVVDTRSGQVGTIERFGLTLTSRWD